METDAQYKERRRKAALRTNYANMSQLVEGRDAARKILRRKRSDLFELRAAGYELLKCVRSLRGWLDTAHDQLNWARRGKAIEQGKRLKAERLLEETSCKLAKESKL